MLKYFVGKIVLLKKSKFPSSRTSDQIWMIRYYTPTNYTSHLITFFPFFRTKQPNTFFVLDVANKIQYFLPKMEKKNVLIYFS